MAELIDSIDNLVGETPLFRLGRLVKELNLEANILAKLEYFNPTGSVKDRVAKSMLDEAEKSGRLKHRGTVIEPTSGNTGIGLAAIAVSRGYRMIVVMPENMSKERQKQIKAYGAEIVLTPVTSGMKGAIEKAEELQKQISGAFVAGQFVNPANPAAHRYGTGPEIWDTTKGKVDIFVAGVGTGGTISGVGEFLKSKNSAIEIVAVEPAGSAVLSGNNPGSHKIQGIGAGFVPPVLNREILDRIIQVRDEDAYNMAEKLARTEGLLTGISSGAALWAAVTLARQSENSGKNIVALLPDSGNRYFSTGLFESR